MWPLYYTCIETSDICNFARFCHNNYDNFHILGIQPVYGYMENKVNEWMNKQNSQIMNQENFYNVLEVIIMVHLFVL